MADWTGIYKHGAGYRAVVSQGRDRAKIKRTFPATATLAEMQAWRRDTQAAYRVTRKQRANRGTFEGDAKRYLQVVSALPTHKDRTRQIQAWVQAFGTKQRDRITSTDIRYWRDHWLTEPRAKDKPPLAPATVNLRLRALSNLYRVLDGPRAENPVRDVEECREPPPRPRDLDYATIRAILDKLPDKGKTEKGKPRPTVSLTKIRLRILAYTGLPPSQLMRLRAQDLDLQQNTLSLPGRKKGRGTDAKVVPLLPQARAAFADLDAAKAWGRFSTHSVYKSFRLAAKAAKVDPLPRPYDLRHSFLTVVYDLTGSLEVVMAFAQHADRATALRYTQRAAARVLQQHAGTLGDHFSG